MLHPQLQIKNKILYLQFISCADDKKSLDLNIEKQQPHKKAKFSKICNAVYRLINILNKTTSMST